LNIKKKIVLGSMKLKKYFSNSKELSEFLIYAHQKGIRKIHVSREYNSYKLLLQSLKLIKKKFKFIVKLAEPSDINKKFNLRTFKNKLKKYLNELGSKNIHTLQWINRYKLDHPKKNLEYKEEVLNKIENTIKEYKKKKIIKSFYFFSYHVTKNILGLHPFIDGITCYRNMNDYQYDSFAKKYKFKIIAMRPLGGDKKLLKKINLKKLIMFNLKNKLISEVIVGANNRNQLDKILEIF
tara:strand:- start:10 stop:723 length:714 start_codon:yes stop_codon:yes gene_type:complete